MKIGIFDSGLGGLIIAKAIFKKFPQYDYLYLGDTKRVPYGNRSQKQILDFTKQALRFLFAQDCKLVIIACNTSSAKALRKIQREFLPKYFPDRRVLGVIVPTLESIPQSAKRIGVLATISTAVSHTYQKEMQKIRPGVKVYEQGAPKLVPLIEANRIADTPKPLQTYIKPLLAKKIDALVLGCTHYPILKLAIKKRVGKNIAVISQEEIIPSKLADYLKRHPEIAKNLGKSVKKDFAVTKINKSFEEVAERLFGRKIKLKVVSL